MFSRQQLTPMYIQSTTMLTELVPVSIQKQCCGVFLDRVYLIQDLAPSN